MLHLQVLHKRIIGMWMNVFDGESSDHYEISMSPHHQDEQLVMLMVIGKLALWIYPMFLFFYHE